MNLMSLRAEIDRIDSRILELLDERMEKALLIRRHKNITHDPERERQVLARLGAKAGPLAHSGFIESLYGLIMGRSRELQDQAPTLVGFQGLHGAYSEAAAAAWMPEGVTLPFPEFSQVFEAVAAGSVDYGVVPVENTLGGAVSEVNALLISTELRVVGAVNLPVSHCLLVPPGSDHRAVRVVYSHPQALSQCQGFLKRNGLEGREYYNTAGAALKLALESTQGAAAIASRQAAERYGLEVMVEDIQDSKDNRTRFFVLSREGLSASTGDKCSAVFFTNDKAGDLFSILSVFAQAGINLTRIESIPSKPGDYAIFIDFAGAISAPKVAEAVALASQRARDFTLLGCYKELNIKP